MKQYDNVHVRLRLPQGNMMGFPLVNTLKGVIQYAVLKKVPKRVKVKNRVKKLLW